MIDRRTFLDNYPSHFFMVCAILSISVATTTIKRFLMCLPPLMTVVYGISLPNRMTHNLGISIEVQDSPLGHLLHFTGDFDDFQIFSLVEPIF